MWYLIGLLLLIFIVQQENGDAFHLSKMTLLATQRNRMRCTQSDSMDTDESSQPITKVPATTPRLNLKKKKFYAPLSYEFDFVDLDEIGHREKSKYNKRVKPLEEIEEESDDFDISSGAWEMERENEIYIEKLLDREFFDDEKSENNMFIRVEDNTTSKGSNKKKQCSYMTPLLRPIDVVTIYENQTTHFELKANSDEKTRIAKMNSWGKVNSFSAQADMTRENPTDIRVNFTVNASFHFGRKSKERVLSFNFTALMYDGLNEATNQDLGTLECLKYEGQVVDGKIDIGVLATSFYSAAIDRLPIYSVPLEGSIPNLDGEGEDDVDYDMVDALFEGLHADLRKDKVDNVSEIE